MMMLFNYDSSAFQKKKQILPNYTYYVHEKKFGREQKNRQRGSRSLLAIVRLYWVAFVVFKKS